MLQDILTHDERLRLEALAQANQFNAMKPNVSPEGVTHTAAVFERFVREGSPKT